MPKFFGESGKVKRKSLMTDQQMQNWQNYLQNTIEGSPLYQSGSNFLQSLLSNEPNAFSQFEAPYLQQFQQQTAPGIAERFAGMGTGAGASSSSALNNSLAQAGGNLQNQLASLRGNMQMQGLGQALQYAQQPYSNALANANVRSFENVYQPGYGGLGGDLLTSLAGGASQGFGMGAGNMFGKYLFGPQQGQAGF